MMARRDSGASAPVLTVGTAARVVTANAGEEGFGRFDRHLRWLGYLQRLTRGWEVRPVVVRGEQPFVADALETRGPHVAQEAADELGGWQRDRALASGVVLPRTGSYLMMVAAEDAVDRNHNGTSRMLSFQRLKYSESGPLSVSARRSHLRLRDGVV